MRLSRAQLHDLVWSKPMTEIARSSASVISTLRKPAMLLISPAPEQAIGRRSSTVKLCPDWS